MSVRSLNKVMLIGNLTRDPNLRYTPNSTAVCSFGLATNRSWMPADGGEKQERVEFHNIVAWAKLADICGQLLHKGDKVFVEGRIQTRDWKTEDGMEKKTTEVVIDNMIMLASPRGRGSYTPNSDSAAPAASPAKDSAPASDDGTSSSDDQNTTDTTGEDLSDDIPF